MQELPNLTDVNVSNASTRVYSDKVVDIAEKMLQLNMLEMADLVEVLKVKESPPTHTPHRVALLAPASASH